MGVYFFFAFTLRRLNLECGDDSFPFDPYTGRELCAYLRDFLIE